MITKRYITKDGTLLIVNYSNAYSCEDEGIPRNPDCYNVNPGTQIKEVIMESTAVEVMEVVKRPETIPDTIEDLSQFILIGKERLSVYQAKVRAIDKIGMAENVRKAALKDGQDAATAVIYAEAKLGELLKATPQKPPIGFSEGNRMSLPPGIDKRLSHQAQTIANNSDKVEKIIAKAIEQERIPTPDHVYKLIKQSEKEEMEAPDDTDDESGIEERTINDDPPNLYNIKMMWNSCTKAEKKKFIKWVKEYHPGFIKK